MVSVRCLEDAWKVSIGVAMRKVSETFTKVYDGVKKVYDGVRNVTGRCLMVSGRYQIVSRWCPMASLRYRIVSIRCRIVSGRCWNVLGWCPMVSLRITRGGLNSAQWDLFAISQCSLGPTRQPASNSI